MRQRMSCSSRPGCNRPGIRTPAVERFEIFGVKIEIGRSLVRSGQRTPMLVLAFRIVDPHVAHWLAGTVAGIAHMHRRQFHHAVGGENWARLRSERFTKCSPRSTTHPSAQQVRQYSTEGRYAKGRMVMAPPSRRWPGSVRQDGRGPSCECCVRRPCGLCGRDAPRSGAHIAVIGVSHLAGPFNDAAHDADL